MLVTILSAVVGWSVDASNSLQIHTKDLQRAASKVPRNDFKGTSIGHVAHTLNGKLRQGALSLRRCEDLLLEDLHVIQQRIVNVSHPGFQDIYEETGDNRRFRFADMKQLDETYVEERDSIADLPQLAPVLRDSKCRESVMWYVHHLREEEKSLLHAEGFDLPSLPELELKPDNVLLMNPKARAIYRSYDDSLQCNTCHSASSPFVWPSNAGMNTKTSEKVPSWPDSFDVEFVLEVVTEDGQKGLPNISNALGNHFYYSYDRANPENSRALNQHDTCPFFHKMSCNIHHHPDGIYMVLNPGKWNSLCCKAFPVAVIPPWWTTWGLYVDTYDQGDAIEDEADVWEGFRSDRYIFGDKAQLDEHDLLVRANDTKALVRFHATLPPPNPHSHGYWHVMEDMNVRPQDAKTFQRPEVCVPTCGIPGASVTDAVTLEQIPHPLMPWAHIEDHTLAGVFEWAKLHQDDLDSNVV